MNALTNLPNIGPVLAQELESIGITTHEDLLDYGSIETVLKLNGTRHACLNKLYALEGAIQGMRWHDLPRKSKESLKETYLGQLKR